METRALGITPGHVGQLLSNTPPVGESKFTDTVVTFWAQGEGFITVGERTLTPAQEG